MTASTDRSRVAAAARRVRPRPASQGAARPALLVATTRAQAAATSPVWLAAMPPASLVRRPVALDQAERVARRAWQRAPRAVAARPRVAAARPRVVAARAPVVAARTQPRGAAGRPARRGAGGVLGGGGGGGPPGAAGRGGGPAGSGGAVVGTGGRGGGTAGAPGSGGSTSGGGRYFPAAAWFYQDISGAPLASRSAQITQWLTDNGGWGTGAMQIDFSIEVLEAASDTPNRTFTRTEDFYTPDCDNVPVPVPTGGAIEGESGYACTKDGDCHLIVVDRRVNRLFEMWRANITGSTFNGGCLAAWDMTRVYGAQGRGEQCTS